MSRFLPLAFIRAAAVIALSGCMSWRSEALSPAQHRWLTATQPGAMIVASQSVLCSQPNPPGSRPSWLTSCPACAAQSPEVSPLPLPLPLVLPLGAVIAKVCSAVASAWSAELLEFFTQTRMR